jgi:hypothetical protein
MMIHTVISPDILTPENFDDPIYRQNVEILLRGILCNGTIIVDRQQRLRQRLVEISQTLRTSSSGATAQRLIEEILKKNLSPSTRRIVASEYDAPITRDERDELIALANFSGTDACITQSSTSTKNLPSDTALIDIPSYGSSELEVKRRNFAESNFPAVDKMEPYFFEEIILRATRYSKRLRFYDYMIGKGSRLDAFRAGIAKIMQTWISGCHYPEKGLSAEIYTTSHKEERKCETAKKTPYQAFKMDLCDSLSDEYGIPVACYFKFDRNRISHARYLQSDYCIINFERGFDIFTDGGKLRRCVIFNCPQGSTHLEEYRNLPNDRQSYDR